MNATVMKFGGTSVDQIGLVTDLVAVEKQQGGTPIAVVSAFSGETNKLIVIAQDVLKNPEQFDDPVVFMARFQPIVDGVVERVHQHAKQENLGEATTAEIVSVVRDYLEEQVARVVTYIGVAMDQKTEPQKLQTYIVDQIVGLGEIFSAKVLAAFMTVRSGLRQVYRDINLGDVFQIYESGKVTDEQGSVDQEKLYQTVSLEIAKRVSACLERGALPVVTGYVGYIPGGILNTIDRGYTDSTAAMTARGMKRLSGGKDEVKLEIWKEVDGLLSADPKIVGKDKAKLRKNAHFDEAAELSDLAGMKAINPHGIWVLDGEGIPIHVKNTFDPEGPGTFISQIDDLEQRGVRFISGKKGQTVFRVSSSKMIEQKGVAAKIFGACAAENISVDAISTSARTVAFSVDRKDARNESLVAVLSGIGNVNVQDDMAIVCCIGSDMGDRKGLLSWLSGILAANDINIEFDGGDGDRNITFIVQEADYDKAIKVLHEYVFSPTPDVVHRGVKKVIDPFLRRGLRLVGKE